MILLLLCYSLGHIQKPFQYMTEILNSLKFLGRLQDNNNDCRSQWLLQCYFKSWWCAENCETVGNCAWTVTVRLMDTLNNWIYEYHKVTKSLHTDFCQMQVVTPRCSPSEIGVGPVHTVSDNNPIWPHLVFSTSSLPKLVLAHQEGLGSLDLEVTVDCIKCIVTEGQGFVGNKNSDEYVTSVKNATKSIQTFIIALLFLWTYT